MKKLWIPLTYVVFLVLLIAPLIKIFTGAWANGWGGFIEAVARPQSLHALWMTFLITIIVTVINTLFGVMLALYLVRADWLGRRMKQLLNSVVDLPFAVSPVIGGLMIVLLLGPNTVLGAFFEDAGFKVVYAMPGMIIATLFVTFPLMVREVMPVLQEIGAQQEEAASTLGAYSWYTFWHVTWPSIRWGVIYGIVLTVARCMGEFGAVLVVSGNIINKTQTATTLVYQDVENFNVIAANSLALILAAVSVGLLLLMEWAKKRKEVH
ncbi:sulfate ABC transporter [Paenibacillus darwinianus]|uniref:Sulfate ABC transporter n=1 Tax=Paenibacillus darwinianus TaxID=1380763 RepID=A0A9W5S2A4_9BACL|nr:sulfate ABC transporter permease subunit [Paenibacillus darwinianus]EXX89732.1 sulfate ABC transporter [Paenibacillus darwinianus]EXX89869.1 sulfate ABC transporter [Paenibacillus darwinianus]EXX90125.1 sulfate ABC transporter [Paenibacillus darwinianus]